MRLPALPPRTRIGPPESAAHPTPGYWLIRLAKGAPLMPCCIAEVDEPAEDVWWDGNPYLAARICGDPASMERVWLWKLGAISKSEHDFRVAEHRWAVAHSPKEPIANPRRRVVLTEIDVEVFLP